MARLRSALCASCLPFLIAMSGSALAAPDPETADLAYIGSVEFRPDIGALNAGWTIRVLEPERDTIAFGLSAALGPAHISGSGVAHLASTPKPDDNAVQLYTINLVPAQQGEERIIRFAYAGPLFGQETGFSINTLNMNKIELTADSFWFPFDMRFDSDIVANLGVRITGDWSAVGVDQVEAVAQGFRILQGDPALDIAFSLLSNSETVQADNYVIHDARTEPGTKIAELTRTLEVCTAYLNDLAGPAGPLPKASIIVTDRAEGGYSRGTLIALTDIENDSDVDLQKFICHELAHYWSHANAGGPENWINEGVADYVALMSVRNALGEDAFEGFMRDYEDRLVGRDLSPIWTPTAEGRPSYLNSYRAAPLALRDLEARMGRPLFFELMRAVMVEKTATTPALLALIERLSDAETRNWFEARLTQ